MNRVFFSDQVTFTFAATPEVDVDDTILAYVFLNGSTTPHTVLAEAPGQITENEYSPGLFRYNITDYEVPNTTTSISINWTAHVSGTPVDTFPVVTTPTPVLQIASDFLEVSTASPIEGATGVDVRSAIVLTFDETLDATALVEGQLFLQRAGTVNISMVTAVINDINAAILTITPLRKLDNNTTYELHVPIGTVAGNTGAGLENDYKLTFKTGVDNISTLFQATDQGVVERAGPLKIVSTAVVVTTPGISSSLPADLACNQGTTEIVFTLSEAVDPNNSIPVLAFTFAPVFSVERYRVNNSLWGDPLTEPTHPTDTIDGGGVAARGTIVFSGQPADAETITIGDGTISVIFEFDDDATFTDTQVVIGATIADTITNLVAAIDASALTMDAIDNTLLTASSVLLIHDTNGVVGNVTITTTSGATVSGMSGGVDATLTVPFTTVDIVGSTVTVTLNQTPVGNAYFTLNLTGLVTAANPNTSFLAVEITYVTALWPFHIGVPEIRNSVRRYISSDLKDCDLAILVTQMGLEYNEVYIQEAIPQQLCSIKASTIMILLEDYMADVGLDGMKQLGPFTVSNKSAWFMNGPYKTWKEKLDECDQTLNAFFNRPQSGIKSSNSYLERPTGSWRIRTWNRSSSMSPQEDENQYLNRAGKIPPRGKFWS